MYKETGREAGNNWEISLKVKTLVRVYEKNEQRVKRISHERVSVERVTHRRRRVCLLTRTSLRGSLFLKLDWNLDKRGSGPREGAANAVKLLEEPFAGSASGSHPPHPTPLMHAPSSLTLVLTVLDVIRAASLLSFTMSSLHLSARNKGKYASDMKCLN